MKKRTLLLLGLGVALLTLAGVALVGAAVNYRVAGQSLSAGGGSRSSALFRVYDTVGQSAIGVAQGGSSRVRAGLWARPRALPAPAGDFAVPQDVIAGGGSVRGSAGYRVQDTVGQSAVGVAQGGSSRVRAGFWHVLRPPPAAPPSAARLLGTYNLMGRPAKPNVVYRELIRVKFYQPGTNTLVQEFWVVGDDNGKFEVLGAPTGTYDISAKAPPTLGNRKKNVNVSGDTPVDFGTLAGGDLNNDNFVLGGDFSLLRANYFKSGDLTE